MRIQSQVNSVCRLLYLSPLFLGVAAGHRGPSAAREGRIRLHTGWKFWRSEEIPDDIIYDPRPDADDKDLEVLKPWILPSANDFIKNPEDHHERPSNEPDIDIEYVKRSYNDSSWDVVNVPHDWAIKLPFLNDSDPIIPLDMGQLPVHGVGWYRRSLNISSSDLEKTIYLDIDGAMAYSMVWVNEKLVGGWPFGYNSYRLDITPYVTSRADNQLAVRVENPRGESSRWYPGAGMFQLRLPQLISVQIRNQKEKPESVTVTTEIHELDGRRVARLPSKKIEFSDEETKSVNDSVSIKNPKLWGPPPSQTPNLYVAVTRVSSGNRLLDTYETQFGIRSLELDSEKGVIINNEPIRLQGVNQHHELGALGTAFNKRAAERQLEMLQELGVNAIRTAHNPPAPELLDLTDHMGFLVFNEIFDCWFEEKSELDFHLIFGDWAEPDLRSFIRRDRNHPSVFIWGYGNEVAEQSSSDEKASNISTYLREIAREEDPTRTASVSMHYSSPDMALPRTQDVISLNYQGEGMRYGPAYEHLTDGTKKTPQYDAYHEAFPDKLIMGSEIASSLSLRGSFVFPVTPFNSAPVNDSSGGDSDTLAVSAYELYTAEAGSSADRVFLTQDTHPFVAGGFVWTGWDYIGEPYWCESCRSGYWGIIDTAGFKKERFWLYQAFWRPDLPMAHIVPHWNWPERKGKITPVHVFSSGNEAELFLNGKSQGLLQRDPLEYRFRWSNVTYEPGEIHVVTYKNGEEWAVDTVSTTGNATSLRLTADRSQISSDGEDLSFVTVQVIDDRGNVVPDVDSTVHFSISGPGKLVATDNGFPADMTAFTSHDRKVFNGLGLAIISATDEGGGYINLLAESSGLDPAEIVLQAS